jgi:hypothetical protein
MSVILPIAETVDNGQVRSEVKRLPNEDVKQPS